MLQLYTMQQILRHSPPLTPLYPILYLTEPFINYHGSGDGEAVSGVVDKTRKIGWNTEEVDRLFG